MNATDDCAVNGRAANGSRPPIKSRIDYGVTRDGVVQMRRRWSANDPWVSMLLLHGINEHSGRYEHVGAELAAAGVETIALDHRGFGLSGGRRSYVNRFSDYLDDVEDQLVRIRALGLPIVLFGHSMGGLIALRYVLDHRPQPDLLALSGPALDANVPAPLRLAAPIAGRLLPRLRIPAPVMVDQLSTDTAVGDAYLTDPLVVRRTTPGLGAAMLAEMRWTTDHVRELSLPTFVQHGGDDTLVPPGASEPLQGLPGVQRRVYPGLRHEIFNEPSGPSVVGDLIDWLRRQV